MSAGDQTARLAAVRAEIAARRERDGIFAGLYATNPRWSIILELEAALLAGRPQILLSKLIRDAGMSHTTGLRIIDSLVVGDWLTSTKDPRDDRRRLIALGPCAVRALAEYRARQGYAQATPAKPPRGRIDLPSEPAPEQIDLEDAIAASLAKRKDGRQRLEADLIRERTHAA
jgi:DNA-binding MarR family transcriptional regulator